ncbi:ParB N-terminal domain-containing protein [Paludisphaera mucosa]|uniref:ParB N-terminal domain-containing protein n=1 Tax=Paludisphaera mucosa TaxID=3030827 RepID=A0ABT6FLQ9_9BACT|nr:ParB N-terminal domain-containing protein [Paludisphaera mucosa]MDG3008508.1 ParB N-terminal domain-containing protein [Paludisphaera mucosa]
MLRPAAAPESGEGDAGVNLAIRTIDYRIDGDRGEDEDPEYTVRRWLIEDVASHLAGSEVRLVRLPMDGVWPADQNDLIYRRVDDDDPEIRKLAESIGANGLDPITVTTDLHIVSGHRRHAACRRLGWEYIECFVTDYDSRHPDFEKKLVAFNSQRVKTIDEVLKEVIVSHEADAYDALIEHRRARSAVPGTFLKLGGRKTRKDISPAKGPMLGAVLRIVAANKPYWPMSDRSVHYELLNDPPLRHASKPESRYKNHPTCYQDLCDLLTRARLAGLIEFDAIADPTRPMTKWDVHRGVGGYIEKELAGFLRGYARDLMQSQPNHVEIVGEKNTVEASIRSVAMDFCIPYTIGRGYCSLDPRRMMAERYEASGKDKLIILIMSDFDPEGEDIAHTFARSMRDDFGLRQVHAKKVCLNHEQAVARNLPQTFDIKKSSSRYKKHAAKYGDRAHELEALPAAERSRLLREAIEGVIDADAFNAEQDREKEDAAKLNMLRQLVRPSLLQALGDGGEAKSD